MSDPEFPEEPDDSNRLEPHNTEDWDEPFARQSKGIKEVLLAVEDALMDTGYDDSVVATESGTWHWQTVERARTDAAERGEGE